MSTAGKSRCPSASACIPSPPSTPMTHQLSLLNFFTCPSSVLPRLCTPPSSHAANPCHTSKPKYLARAASARKCDSSLGSTAWCFSLILKFFSSSHGALTPLAPEKFMVYTSAYLWSGSYSQTSGVTRMVFDLESALDLILEPPDILATLTLVNSVHQTHQT